MKEYGYYSMDMKFADGTSVLPNAKLISLNTQDMNNDNWWLAGTRQDPGGMMEWLENELAAIEKANGICYIIGHIMPNAFLHNSGGRYKILMERY